MNTERRVVFFDIDGTLWDRQNNIPDSTFAAIKMLRDNGHLAFISSGRTRGYITSPKLLSIGFDGIVSGCGTMIEYNDEILFYKKLDPDFAAETIDTVRKLGGKPILEGAEYLYMEEYEFGDDPYGKKLFSELGDKCLSIDNTRGQWEISKFSCDTSMCDLKVVEEYLGSDYDLIIHNSSIVEFVPKGFNKGTGIAKTCEILGIDIKNAIAIGDSVNDLDMFRAAGFAVAMGNGSDVAKNEADYITTSLHDDGIYNALKYLNLI